MQRSAVLAGALLGLAACSPPSTVQPTSGASTITAGDMYSRIAFLASDALRGRDTPSPGLDSAAAYLVREYTRLGLEPAGENNTFYQHYPFPLRALDTQSLHFGTVDARNQNNQMLVAGRDFYATGAANAAGAAMGHGTLVYVGRLSGGELPAFNYGGTVPMVLLPGGDTRDFRTAASRARSAAQRAGATALVVVLGPEYSEEAFRAAAERAGRPQRGLGSPAGEIPVFFVREEAARRILQRGGLTLAASGPRALAGVGAHFAATLALREDSRAPNVAAVLRGSDPALRDEYVILSAHMDHVGVGAPVNGDSIYNGADDDASGNAALLEVAEALASQPTRPRRSVLFLHVSGEEKGLLGSRWYSDHPTVPIGQIVANVNVDMIGRNAPDSVVVIGKNYSSLGQTMNAVVARHPELGLTAADDLWPEQRFFFRSDHFNFARKEIPALFFFTGVHPDYHRPSDEVDRINTDKAMRVARLIFHTVSAIANAPTRPVWDPKGLAEVRGMTR